MIEKVNPSHPDKIADRIAGAIVDLAYTKEENPKIAVEVLIGHGECNIIMETSVFFEDDEIMPIVERISECEDILVHIKQVHQDINLENNQIGKIRCGDNGIFKGTPLTLEQSLLSCISHEIYDNFPSDGKYILDLENEKLIICQSKANEEDIKKILNKNDYLFRAYDLTVIINPLGDWTGGIDVDSGATNRKLGSDMADSVTGGGIQSKDLSKADVSLNIYAWLKAQKSGKEVNLCCAIGDEEIDGKPYREIVKIAKNYIKSVGGFEKFAEWGLF